VRFVAAKPLGRSSVLLAVGALGVAALAGCAGGTKPAAHTVTLQTPSPPAPPSATPSPRPVSPLTGLPAADPASIARPALSIKIDNIASALPQAGVNQADIVTEALVEGGLTRLLATYQSTGASAVGPVRSARPVDADLLRELNGGYFGYSGAAAGEMAPVIDHSTSLLLGFDDHPSLYYRAHGRYAPHNVFTSTASLWAAGHAQRPTMPAPPRLFSYSATPGAGTPAGHVTMAFSPMSSAAWTWSGGHWLRTQDGSPDVLVDGSRVTADNIVILSVATAGTGITDAAGNEDPLPVVIGSGTCWLLRDGQVQQGTWQRPTVARPMVIVDAAGHPLPLHPGRTWIELLPKPHAPAFS